jgi:YD repeat-containing protein
VQDQSGTASYEYSAKGELTKETKVTQGRTYVTSYSFDKNGNLSTITYPSGRKVNYALDAADRVSSAMTTAPRSPAQILASSIAHKPFGGISSLTYGNGLNRTVSYDQQYRISSIQTGAVQNLSYTHDPNGSITAIANLLNPTKNKTFSYDAPQDGSGNSFAFTYDCPPQEIGSTSSYRYA